MAVSGLTRVWCTANVTSACVNDTQEHTKWAAQPHEHTGCDQSPPTCSVDHCVHHLLGLLSVCVHHTFQGDILPVKREGPPSGTRQPCTPPHGLPPPGSDWSGSGLSTAGTQSCLRHLSWYAPTCTGCYWGGQSSRKLAKFQSGHKPEPKSALTEERQPSGGTPAPRA